MRVRTAQTPERGRWHVEVDGTRLTGGSWAVTRTGQPVHLALDADEPWRPGPLPWLMRVVTTVVPVFRRWPTTYRWRCDVRTDGSSPRMVTQWHQTGSRAAESYRRATAT